MENMDLPLGTGHLVYSDIIEQVADEVLVTDKNGIIEYVNPSLEKSTGYSKEELLGQNPRIFKSGKQSIEYYQSLWETILAGSVFNAKVINKKKNGQLYVVDQTISPIFNEKKEIIHFVSVWKDVTEIARVEEQLKFEKKQLEEIVSFDEKLIKIRKSDHLIDYIVAKARRILGVEKCSVMFVDRKTKELYTKSTTGFLEETPMLVNISGSIAERAILEGQSLLVNDLASDGRFKDLKQPSYLGNSFMIVPIKSDQDVMGVINVADKRSDSNGIGNFDKNDLKILNTIATDVAIAIENVSFYKELHYLTITDELTHMHNYRYFVNSLEYELKRLKRFQGDLCLLMMDIDGFKSYNDQLGHLAGDELLRKVGEMIQSKLREVDVLCRYGGDEFVAILPETNKEGAVVVTEKIRKFIEDAQFPKSITLSIGVAQYRNKMTRHELTFNADKALYQAKDQGKNKVCIFGHS
jgi:diguanylate cyclase (GGDEF)-like protein/PAS domain S-box-containing protein